MKILSLAGWDRTKLALALLVQLSQLSPSEEPTHFGETQLPTGLKVSKVANQNSLLF